MTTGRSRSEILNWPHQDIIDLAAYDLIQPFGSQRDNWHMAVMASMFAGVHTPKNKRRPTVKDFMYVDSASKKQDETRAFFGKLRAKAHAN